jgi:hypothetical protein
MRPETCARTPLLWGGKRRNEQKRLKRGGEWGTRRYKVVNLTRNWCQLPASWHSFLPGRVCVLRTPANATSSKHQAERELIKACQQISSRLHLATEVARKEREVRWRAFQSQPDAARKANGYCHQQPDQTASHERSRATPPERLIDQSGKHKRDELVNAPRRSRIKNLNELIKNPHSMAAGCATVKQSPISRKQISQRRMGPGRPEAFGRRGGRVPVAHPNGPSADTLQSLMGSSIRLIGATRVTRLHVGEKKRGVCG